MSIIQKNKFSLCRIDTKTKSTYGNTTILNDSHFGNIWKDILYIYDEITEILDFDSPYETLLLNNEAAITAIGSNTMTVKHCIEILKILSAQNSSNRLCMRAILKIERLMN
uniref:Uncharacterized protein n=1 Tax=Megaselia scalaris TaxID=36166 RepID=T1GEL3_MEGSC